MQPPPALNESSLAMALAAALPPEQRAAADELAGLLAAIAQGRLAPDQAGAQIAGRPELAALLRALAGTRVASAGALISFGSGNQVGDVTIGGDVVGGDQIRLSVNLGDSGLSRRRFLIIAAGLALVIVLAGVGIIFNSLSDAQRIVQANKAVIIDVLTNIANLDTQLGLVETSIALLPGPQVGGTQRRLMIESQIANLKESLAMRPLRADNGAQLVQNLISSGADPSAVQTFYASLLTAQSGADQLLATLGMLANQPPSQPEWIDYYQRRADLDQRSFTNNATYVYLNGLLVLSDLGYRQEIADAALGTLHYLEPRRLLSEEQIIAGLAAAQERTEQLKDERQTLASEGERLIAEIGDIKPGDTWDVVVGKAIILRKSGRIAESAAIFARYGEMFAAADPTAAQYALTAQAFTRQIIELDVEGGMYVYQITPGGNGDAAGLRVGDVVIALNRAAVTGANSFEALINAIQPGIPFTATLLRLGDDGAFTRLELSLVGRPIDSNLMPI